MVGCFDCENGSGEFSYPQNLDHLQYNFRDTLRAEWQTDYQGNLGCDLALWWWTEDQPWKKSFNTSVPCNGTEDIPLNLATNVKYLAQLNLNHTFSNGSSNLILSGLFDVNHDSDAAPMLWKNNVAAAATTQPTEALVSSDMSRAAALQTTTHVVTTTAAISTAGRTTATAQTAVTSATTAQEQVSDAATSRASGGLGEGVIAGIVIGVVLGLALLAGLGFYLRRRRGRRDESSGFEKPQPIAEAYLPWEQIDHPGTKGRGDYYPPSSPPEKSYYGGGSRRVAEMAVEVPAVELDARPS